MIINPIINEYSNKYGTIPFKEIEFNHFLPAIEFGLQEAYANVEIIKNYANNPTFKNTIEALEFSSYHLDKATNVYFNLYSLESNAELKELSEIISPKLAKLSGDIYTDELLFSMVNYLFINKNENSYTVEELRLLEQTYISFKRNGALLNKKDKLKIQEIDKALSTLSPKFSKNSLDATNSFDFLIEDIKELSGIPQNAIDSAKYLAEKKGNKEGWIFNLQMPSYLPVLQYAENRELREKISTCYGIKNLDGKFDNRKIVLEIVNLKNQRANLLGYKTHAHYMLENRMAKNPDNVLNFLNSIYEVAYPKSKEELEELKKYALRHDNISDFQSWDFAYYSQKLKKEKFNFDAELLRPYLKAENVTDGIFKVANKLYDLTFHEIFNIDLYHPDVKTYEVVDQSNNFLGILYMDLYPRETKRSGAWMNTFQVQGLKNGEMCKPHILISGNLTPSTPSSPSLLSFDEARTLFHEFGHALHGLLSDVKYTSLASPNVYWDFVELPSQIMENWLLEEETLNLFAKHYKTGEIIPSELVKKIKLTQTFNAGSMNNRQLSLAFLDLAWYTTNPDQIDSVEQFENKINEKTRLLPINSSNTSTGFSHIFAGGYSAGYYSYKWAEVLDADAFEFFKERGIFNKEASYSFRKNILSMGNTVDPMELYIRFKGSAPDSKALLRRDGLI